MRAADPGDSRARRLAVTDVGARLAHEAIEVVQAADASFFPPAGQAGPLLRVLGLLSE